MTNNKAIEWQEAFKKTYKNSPMEKEAYEACDMAIKALRNNQIEYGEDKRVKDCYKNRMKLHMY